MKQAIAGVTTPDQKEATVMTVWPSVAAMSLAGLPLGQMLGQLYSINVGFYIFTVGNLFCLLMIPIAVYGVIKDHLLSPDDERQMLQAVMDLLEGEKDRTQP